MLHAPKTKPQDYGAKDGDFHLIFNAQTKTVKAYQFGKGTLIWEKPALCDGQDPRWWVHKGDTPPGVYYLGAVYDDKANGTLEPPYGWIFFDLVDQEGREDGNGRSGIGLHGGGSSLADPYAPYQTLTATHGCIKMHNADLYHSVYPLYKKAKVWLSVYQDDL